MSNQPDLEVRVSLLEDKVRRLTSLAVNNGGDSVKQWAAWYGASDDQEAQIRKLIDEATASDMDVVKFAFRLEAIAPPRAGYDRMMEARYLVNGLHDDAPEHPLYLRYKDIFVQD